MKVIPYKKSNNLSLGVELELQIINPTTFDLATKAKELIRAVRSNVFAPFIKPEVTQSMIEINSSIHSSPKTLYNELLAMRELLLQQADLLKIRFCGGGMHPFQKWSLRKVFPARRFKNLTHQYQYLSKHSTVFGQHIHIGCNNAETALYLSHALARYVPHFIAITASSPFYQGVDTGYYSSRPIVFNVFPSSGTIPLFTTWQEFSQYFYKMRGLGIIESMKDLYWDIRPKPEYGTVEIRVCDTPLTLKKAVMIAAYVQVISAYLINEKPVVINPDLYFIYNYNRFQAMRYAFDGDLIHPTHFTHVTIAEDILETIKIIERYANQLDNMGFISQIMNEVLQKKNDSILLRQLLKELGSFQKMVCKQCDIWEI